MGGGNEPSLLVIGAPTYIGPALANLTLTKKYHIRILDLTNLTRNDAYIKLMEISKEWPFSAMMMTGPSFGKLIPFDDRVFGPFVPHLKFVTSLSAGYDSTIVDIDYLTSRKIILSNNPNAVSEPTATTTVMLILQTIRAASECEDSVRQRRWEHGERLPRTVDQRDVTVGIIGLGRIGKLVQQKVEALGMKVTYNNRHRLPPAEEGKAVYHSFDSLISTADLISLHMPLTPETHHLLSNKEFAKMKDGVMIVNTSRGSTIDEEALVRAMKCGKVLRVGLDVFEHEPKVHPYLLESIRATLLPHWSGQTTRCHSDFEYEGLANFVKWVENGRGNSPVNIPDGGWE